MSDVHERDSVPMSHSKSRDGKRRRKSCGCIEAKADVEKLKQEPEAMLEAVLVQLTQEGSLWRDRHGDIVLSLFHT